VALVLLVVPVGAYSWLTTEAGRPGWRAWFAYLALAGGVAAPWYIAMALTEPGYLSHFLWRNNFLRYVDAYDHQHGWWFYLPVLFVANLPWSLMWAWLAYFLMSRNSRLVFLRSPGVGFCVLAFGWCLLFFSMAGCKSPLYLAPALAPLALLHGVCLDAILFHQVGQKDRFLGYARQVLPRRATTTVLLVSMVCYAVTGVLGWEEWVLVTVEIVLTSAALAFWWKYGRRASPQLAWSACAAATLAMVVIPARDLVVGVASKHTVETVAKAARRWPGMEVLPVVSYGRQWPSASFYLRHDMVPFFEVSMEQSLVGFLKQQREVLVLVERGALLDKLVGLLPPSLEARVQLPQREGQAALVVVRQRHRN
jgi:hypothetical protein